ncbi:GTSE1 protein, partial [Odontophorus gujanensis]|nr:GTSE1 protein [Odontophorus gujanensis]
MDEGREVALQRSRRAVGGKLSACVDVSDFPLLTDEKFDFDLSLSPASGSEDEVFVGPLGHKEKCVAANIDAKRSAEKKSVPTSDDKLVWSPLTGDKFVEIFKEAHLLALRIESGSKSEENKVSPSEENGDEVAEQFVEDLKSKMKILKSHHVEKSPRTVKRETYCVGDSPACLLLPFQKESDKLVSGDKTHIVRTPSDRSPDRIQASPTRINSSPLTQEQKTVEKNKKATSKLLMPKLSSTLRKSSMLMVEKAKPGKHTSISTKRDTTSVGSSEDLISDKSNAASDVFESSFTGSSSVQDKKVLPAPNKPGLKKTHLKLPGVGTGRTRKSTSTSSLSVSSVSSNLNSSLPISPIGKNGKLNATSKAGVSGSKPSSSTNRLSLARPTRVSSLQAVNTERSSKQARSASTPKISSAVSLAKSSASAVTVPSEPEGSGVQRLRSLPSLQKLCQQNKDGSTIKGSLCPKPRARVLSVPTSQAQVPVKTVDVTPNKSATKAVPSLGLTLYGKVGSAVAVSTPLRASEDGIFQIPCERPVSMTPASSKRSALPTPVRRISGFPAATPKATTSTVFSPHAESVRRSSSFSTRKALTAGSKQVKETQSSSSDEPSPPPVLPLMLDFSPEKAATEIVEDKLEEAEVQNRLAEERQTKEIFLVDIGAENSLPQTLECGSRPLIDLSNTPEVNKIIPLKPTFSGQVKLIDLSSPLITLSPDINKENLDSPLLKF